MKTIDALLDELENTREIYMDRFDIETLDEVPQVTARVLTTSFDVPWTEVGISRVSISIEHRDMARLGIILMLATLDVTDRQFWIPFARRTDDVNAFMVPVRGPALVVDGVEVTGLRYRGDAGNPDEHRLRPVCDRWDDVSITLVLQNSLHLHALGAPDWLRGAVVLGGGPKSKLAIGKCLLDFYLSAGNDDELLFDSYHGLAPRSLEACFYLPGSAGWHDPAPQNDANAGA